MDSYSYNAYARYYDKNFPSDFQKSCNESAALREDYQKNIVITNVIEKINKKDKDETKITNDVLDTYVILNPCPKVD
jgi:hypothetical protein